MSKLQQVVKSSYHFLNTSIPILQEQTSNYFLHNRQRISLLKIPSPQTFDGYMNCGAACFLLKHYLKKSGIPTKIMKSRIGYGKHLEDHCFLLDEDSAIIDPTYRQMFLTQSKPDDNYMKYLFEENPFYFIGKKNDLDNYFKQLSKVHLDTYGRKLSDENIVFWEKYQELKTDVDLDKVRGCSEYAERKGRMYRGLSFML
jgi:hypothetical protein